jgi:GT2 family glycosyltransferase
MAELLAPLFTATSPHLAGCKRLRNRETHHTALMQNNHTSQSETTVAVVILNWNGLEDTLGCLESLSLVSVGTCKIDIVVVDNGSDQDPTEPIKSRFSHVEVMRLTKNIGYAAGCNFGATRAIARGADFILFLNNDTVITPSLLGELLACFSRNADVGIASPVIYEMFDPSRIDFAGAHINFALGRFSHFQKAPTVTTPFETDYVSGCSMMISRAAIERIGSFDEKLFAYFEDVDLCLRARRVGLKLMCVATATVRHKGSTSTRRSLTEGTISPLKHYLIARNRIAIINRYAPTAERWFYLLIINPARVCFYIGAFVVRARWTKLRWFLRGMLDGLRGNFDLPGGALSAE